MDRAIEWYDIAGKRKALALIRESLRDGRKILEKLDGYGVPVYLIPGNTEWNGALSGWPPNDKDYWPELKRGLRNIKDCQFKLIDAGPVQFIGHGITPGPEVPQTAADRKLLPVKELRRREKEFGLTIKWLGKLFAIAKTRAKPVIYLTHNMPYGTAFDKINNSASPRNGQHWGSVVSREIIKKHQPLVAIGGHMHEYYGKIKLGRTLVVNAGFGGDKITMMDIDGTRLRFMFSD
jgi:Icc-related predicted phosphoesterase